mmetsp:Transcript_55694/g.127931  ORF Transcript_55694/g.127931 Transcript_55694/m.127931 type:complete len:801 (-) Transcript_55694:312-2714(-)
MQHGTRPDVKCGYCSTEGVNVKDCNCECARLYQQLHLSGGARKFPQARLVRLARENGIQHGLASPAMEGLLMQAVEQSAGNANAPEAVTFAQLRSAGLGSSKGPEPREVLMAIANEVAAEVIASATEVDVTAATYAAAMRRDPAVAKSGGHRGRCIKYAKDIVDFHRQMKQAIVGMAAQADGHSTPLRLNSGSSAASSQLMVEETHTPVIATQGVLQDALAREVAESEEPIDVSEKLARLALEEPPRKSSTKPALEAASKLSVAEVAEVKKTSSKACDSEQAPPRGPVLGCRVLVCGLRSRPDLNGRLGLVVSRNQSSERWGVRVDREDAAVALKESNLKVQTQNAWDCTLWLQLEARGFVSLRFSVGDRVECCCLGGWLVGTVKELFMSHRMPPGYCAAYSVCLDRGNQHAIAPLDTDTFIRAAPVQEANPLAVVEACSIGELETVEQLPLATRGRGLRRCGFCGRPSEDTLRRCKRCHAVAYCNQECQQRGWSLGHRHSCGDARFQRLLRREPDPKGLSVSELLWAVSEHGEADAEVAQLCAGSFAMATGWGMKQEWLELRSASREKTLKIWIQGLVRAARAYTDEPLLQLRVLVAMKSYCFVRDSDNPDFSCKQFAIDAGAAGVAVSAIQRHQLHPAVAQNAVCALATLTGHNQMRQQAIVSAGAIPAIIDILQRHPSEADLHEEAFRCLTHVILRADRETHLEAVEEFANAAGVPAVRLICARLPWAMTWEEQGQINTWNLLALLCEGDSIEAQERRETAEECWAFTYALRMRAGRRPLVFHAVQKWFASMNPAMH